MAIVAPSIAIFLYCLLPNNREDLKFFGSAIVASASLVSAFYIGRGLRYNSDSQRETRTLSFPSRWNDPSLFDKKTSVHRLREQLYDPSIDTLLKRREKLEELFKEDPALKVHLVDIFNFFEEMAVCVEYEIVDSNLLRDFFRSIFFAHFEAFEFWLVDRQSNRSKRLSSLVNLYRRWSV